MDTFVEMIEKANSETSDFGQKKSPLFGKFDQLLVRLDSLFGDTRYDFLMKPKMRTSSSIPIIFNKVDFPEPEDPMIATISPFSTERSIPFNTCKLESPIG